MTPSQCLATILSTDNQYTTHAIIHAATSFLLRLSHYHRLSQAAVRAILILSLEYRSLQPGKISTAIAFIGVENQEALA